MMVYLKMILSFVTASAVVLYILPRLSRIADRIGLVDIPAKRKVHKEPKPLVGGISMMIAITVACLLFVPLSGMRGFYIGLFMLALSGFLDDYKELDYKLRIGVQVAAALFMVYLGGLGGTPEIKGHLTVINSFGDLIGIGPIYLGTFSVPVTVFCIAGVINAVNMQDGIDGLCGASATVAFAFFALFALLNGQYHLAILSTAFIGALLAFLRYNWHPSSLFMGDAGSMSIGFALAYLSVALTQNNLSVVPPAAPLLVLAVPITDTIVIMINRTLGGRSPFASDKYHLHHLLLRFGLGYKTAAKTIIYIMVLLSSAALAGTIFKWRDYALFSVFMLYFASVMLASHNLKALVRAFHKRSFKSRA